MDTTVAPILVVDWTPPTFDVAITYQSEVPGDEDVEDAAGWITRGGTRR